MIKWLLRSDESVVKALQDGGSGEDQAIRHLLKTQGGVIRRFVTKNGGSDEDASDVLQEGLTALVLNVRKGGFKGESKLSTYLFAICKGIWYKKAGRNERFKAYRNEQRPEEGHTDTPEVRMASDELMQTVDDLLSQIGDTCKTALRLWARHFSMAEIASQLGYANAQVAMNKKNKCMNKLQALVAERPDLRKTLRSFLT